MGLLDTRLECHDDKPLVHFGELLNEMSNDMAIILMVVHDVIVSTFYMDFNVSAIHKGDDGIYYVHEGEIAHVLAYVIDDLDEMLEDLAESNFVLRVEIGGEHFVAVNCAHLQKIFGNKEV